MRMKFRECHEVPNSACQRVSIQQVAAVVIVLLIISSKICNEIKTMLLE